MYPVGRGLLCDKHLLFLLFVRSFFNISLPEDYPIAFFWKPNYAENVFPPISIGTFPV